MGRLFNNNLFLQEGNGGGGTGTTDYNDLTNKPAIDGVVLTKNTTKADLGITTVGSDKYGIRGDYSTKYGIIDAPNGLITHTASSKEVVVKAGIQLLMPGSDTKTQIGSDIKYTINSTSDVTLFLADGEIKEAEGVYFQTEEPENGQEAYLAWFNPELGKWQFKSNDDGNVWRTPTKASPLADVHLSDVGVTRVDYVGYRVLNDQIFSNGSAPDNMVTTDTAQEITGIKSFENPITFSNNNGAVNFQYRGSGLHVSGTDSNIYVGNTGYPLVLESSVPVKMNGKQLATLDDISPALNNQSTDTTASSSKAVWDKVKVLEDNPVSGNDDFLITGTGVLATVNSGTDGGREFTKTKDGLAYGMVYANTSGYDGPILVSEDKDIVIYTPGGQLGGSFELDGKTWYYSAAEYFIPHGAGFTLGLIKVNTASDRTFNTLDAAKYVIENGYSYIEKGLITKVNNLTTNVNNMEPTVQEAYTKTNLVAGKNITINEVLPAGGIDNHTLACWHFDGSADNAVANSKFSYTSHSDFEWYTSDPKFGTGSTMNNSQGYNRYIEVSEDMVLSEYTVDFWLKNATSDWIIGYSAPSSLPDGLRIQYKPTVVEITANYINTYTITIQHTDSHIDDDKWHHWAITFDAAKTNVFIDGVLLGTAVRSGDIQLKKSDYPAYLDKGIMDELRISDLVRPLTTDGKFPVPTQPYSVAEPTGKVAINNALTKTSQLTNDSGFLTSVNSKTGNVVLTGADIQTTYTANPEVTEPTTSDINTALTAICEDIHNVLTNVPTGAELMSTSVYAYQAPLATNATLADVIAKVNTILAIMSERGIMKKNS